MPQIDWRIFLWAAVMFFGLELDRCVVIGGAH